MMYSFRKNHHLEQVMLANEMTLRYFDVLLLFQRQGLIYLWFTTYI